MVIAVFPSFPRIYMLSFPNAAEKFSKLLIFEEEERRALSWNELFAWVFPSEYEKSSPVTKTGMSSFFLMFNAISVALNPTEPKGG